MLGLLINMHSTFYVGYAILCIIMTKSESEERKMRREENRREQKREDISPY
jgi:hypothetical protein